MDETLAAIKEEKEKLESEAYKIRDLLPAAIMLIFNGLVALIVKYLI